MTIVIFVAVKEEIAGLLLKMKIEKIVLDKEQRELIYEGRVHNRPVTVVRTGAGIEKARDAAKITLRLYKPELVISTGWAGGTKEGINRGDIVIGTVIHSYGCQSIRSNPKLCSLAAETLKKGEMSFHIGESLTVPRVLFSPEEKREAGNTWHVSMIEMESHGIISVALQEKVSCLMARVISDTCWETASLKPADQFVNDALNKFLLSFLEAV